MILESTMTCHGRQNSIATVTNWQELHTNDRFVLILCIRGMTCPPGTLLPLKLMESLLHPILPQLSKRPATTKSSFSTLPKGQAGKMKKYTTPLTGWHDPGQENNGHQANAWQFSSLNLLCLQPCPNITGWNRVLITDVQDVNTSRKLWHMYFNVQVHQISADVHWQGH